MTKDIYMKMEKQAMHTDIKISSVNPLRLPDMISV